MMACILLVCLGLGWVTNRAHVQRDAVAAVRKSKESVGYDWELTGGPPQRWETTRTIPTARPAWPTWLVDRLGDDYVGMVKKVTLGVNADDPVMVQVGRLPQVEELLISYKHHLTNVGFVPLRHLTNLKRYALNQASDRKTSGAFLKHLAGATRLQVLDLRGIPLDEADMAHLARFADLRRFVSISCGITDAGLVHLSPLAELSDLHLANSPITNLGLAHLERLVALRRLVLSKTRVTSAGLVHLRRLENLVDLGLDLTTVDDLSSLRHFSHLKTIRMRECPIEDDDLADLQNLKTLEAIDLRGTRITDAGLIRLGKIASLKELQLDATKVTSNGVATLKKALPAIKVTN